MSECKFCGKVEDRQVNAPHWTGSDVYADALTERNGWVRVNVCSSPVCREALRPFPKKPRKAAKRRQPVPLYGDYAQLARFSGIATDGTGRHNPTQEV